mmetsp:Transcript_42883/g.69718  ORF Transcript_42883/g.69718 Transcript_42883/m.69718 type:complete len:450 (+) Transcript_42883:300-1649(+)
MSGNVDTWAALGKPRKLDYGTNDDRKNNVGGDSANIEDGSLDSKSVQLEGWVEKQSRYLRSWRHRWLVLRHPYLYTFKSRQNYDSPTEKIELIGCRVVSDPTWTSQLGPFGFEIETAAASSSSSTFAFRIPTRHAKDRWTAALQRAISTGEVPLPNTGSRIVSSGLFRYSGGPPPTNNNSSTMGGASTGGGGGISPSNDDVEEAMLQQVLRQSAIEAGIYQENSGNEGHIVSASTALRIQQDEEYKRTLEEDIRREREASEQSSDKKDNEEEKQEMQQDSTAKIKGGKSDGGGEQKSLMDDDSMKEQLNSATAASASSPATTHNNRRKAANIDDVKKSSVTESNEERKSSSTIQLPMEPEKGPDTCTCMIRLPSGKRLVRRFRKDDTIQIIRKYVQQQGQREEGEQGCFATDHFELVSNFPRKEWKNYGLTLAETRLGSNISFFVHIVN